jgi:hypothetical protein
MPASPPFGFLRECAARRQGRAADACSNRRPSARKSGPGTKESSMIDNKGRMQEAFDALATGDGAPFFDLFAEDAKWTRPGSTAWSGVYDGRETIRTKLMKPLFAQFATRYTNEATRIIADGEFVVVECKGRVTTKSGKPYNNEYCYVCRMRDGKIIELREYLDTALVENALAPPVRAA